MKRMDRQLVEERLALSLAVQQVPVLMIEKLVGILKERKEYRSFSGSHWELPEQGRMGRWKMLQLGHLHTISMTTHKFWGGIHTETQIDRPRSRSIPERQSK